MLTVEANLQGINLNYWVDSNPEMHTIDIHGLLATREPISSVDTNKEFIKYNTIKKYLNNKPLDLIRRSARELGLLEDEMEQEIINIKLQIDIDFSRALKDKRPEKRDLFKGLF